MKPEAKKFPPLRLPQFSEDWRQVTLGEISVKVGSGSTPRGGEQAYQPFGIPFIRSQNVNENELKLDDIAFISKETNQQMKGSIVQANDILLNITGASIGRSCVVPDSFEGGNVNQHVCIVRLTAECEPRFLQPFLSSDRGQRLIFEGQTGSGREGLNFHSIRSFKIAIPDITEQKKIAAFLLAVDEKIRQLARKKELFLKYKKGVMRQIFDQKVRFKDSNSNDFSDWKETPISSVCRLLYGKDQKEVVATDGMYPILGTGGIIGKTNQFLYDKPSVLIGRKGTIDRPRYMDTPFWTVDTLFYTEVFDNCVPKWLFYQFEMINWYRFNEASGVPSLSASTISRIKIKVPDKLEQEKIATFLSAVDGKVELIGRQLEMVKVFKQGLLQQMFV